MGSALSEAENANARVSTLLLHVEKRSNQRLSNAHCITFEVSVDRRLVCSGDDVCLTGSSRYIFGKRIPHVNGVSTRSNGRAPSGTRRTGFVATSAVRETTTDRLRSE
jgi:hypothetical protein